jgi:hypothetical protein
MFSTNYWTYGLTFETGYIHQRLLRLLEFQFYRTKLKPSSHKEFDVNFMVSPKMFDIFFWNIRLENCTICSYGARNFTFIEWKKALITNGYLFVLVFPPKIFDTFLWNSILENFSECSYGQINSISIGLN